MRRGGSDATSSSECPRLFAAEKPAIDAIVGRTSISCTGALTVVFARSLFGSFTKSGTWMSSM